MAAEFSARSGAFGSRLAIRDELCARVRFGKLDIAIVSNVLAHARDPVRALECVVSVLRWSGCAIIACSMDVTDVTAPMARFIGKPAEVLWWIPNDAALVEWCRMAGFGSVELNGAFLLHTRRGPGSTVVMRIAHARPRPLGGAPLSARRPRCGEGAEGQTHASRIAANTTPAGLDI